MPTMPNMPPTGSSDRSEAIARIDANVVYWGTQIKTLHQFRRGLYLFAPAALVVGMLLSLFLKDALWWWGTLATVVATFAVGMYMYHVRAHEFAYHLTSLKDERERINATSDST